jgi:hypothetical protein
VKHLDTQWPAHKSFAVISYDWNDSIIIIYDHNDSGQYYKTIVIYDPT